jgi:hypothetical protein
LVISRNRGVHPHTSLCSRSNIVRSTININMLVFSQYYSQCNRMSCCVSCMEKSLISNFYFCAIDVISYFVTENDNLKFLSYYSLLSPTVPFVPDNITREFPSTFFNLTNMKGLSVLFMFN